MILSEDGVWVSLLFPGLRGGFSSVSGYLIQVEKILKVSEYLFQMVFENLFSGFQLVIQFEDDYLGIYIFSRVAIWVSPGYPGIFSKLCRSEGYLYILSGFAVVCFSDILLSISIFFRYFPFF